MITCFKILICICLKKEWFKEISIIEKFYDLGEIMFKSWWSDFIFFKPNQINSETYLAFSTMSLRTPSREYSGHGTALATHRHPLPKLTKIRAIPLLPLFYRANILIILRKMKYTNFCASSNGYSDIKYMQFNKTDTDSPVILTWKSLVPSTSYVSWSRRLRKPLALPPRNTIILPSIQIY
jgi:hypothetical protein